MYCTPKVEGPFLRNIAEVQLKGVEIEKGRCSLPG